MCHSDVCSDKPACVVSCVLSGISSFSVCFSVVVVVL